MKTLAEGYARAAEVLRTDEFDVRSAPYGAAEQLADGDEAKSGR